MVAGKANVEVEQVKLKGPTKSARGHANTCRYVVDAEELSYLNAENCVRRPRVKDGHRPGVPLTMSQFNFHCRLQTGVRYIAVLERQRIVDCDHFRKR